MPKVLPAVFSYENMKAKFNQDNPDEPYTRRADLESGVYALDKWVIRVDDEQNAISTVGWKEHSSHTVVGGMYATAKGREIGGNNRALQDAREPQLNDSKPLVAAFGHRDGDNARWISNAKRNGWSFPDSDNWEQMKTLLPTSVLSAWLSKYPENMAIRSIRGKGDLAKCIYLDDPTSQWFSLIKSNKYKMELGSAGFNVIRLQDNKRLNSIGLSRSQAKHMIADLEAGKDVSQYTKRRKVKEMRGGWKSVLRKWMPLRQDGFMELTQYKTKDSGNYESMIHRDLMEGKGDGPNRILVAGHYINRGHQRVKTTDAQLYHWSQTILHSGKPTARSNWFYMTPNGSSRDFKVMFDMIPRGERLPQQGGMRSKLTNPTTQEVLVFTTIYDKNYGDPDAKWYDMWDEREEER
jgi:hypothetical protein